MINVGLLDHRLQNRVKATPRLLAALEFLRLSCSRRLKNSEQKLFEYERLSANIAHREK